MLLRLEQLFDDEVFPMLDCSRPLQKQRALNSTWEASKVKETRKNMLQTESIEVEASSSSLPVERFPKLFGRQSPHPLESATQSSWRDLKDLGEYIATKREYTPLEGKVSEQMPRAEEALKNNKKRKKRWQALRLG